MSRRRWPPSWGGWWRHRTGRATWMVDVALYAWPWPSVYVNFEETFLTVGAGLRSGATDDAFFAGVEVELPGVLADALVIVWPGTVAPSQRRAAARAVWAAMRGRRP